VQLPIRRANAAIALAILATSLATSCSTEAAKSKSGQKKEQKKESKEVDWKPPSEGILDSDLKKLDAALAASGQATRQKAAKGAEDIVVIVLDTVRADHLGLYGYDQNTSPNLDAWSKGAHVWKNAEADGPWTLPSHASMFTGLPTRLHGAHAPDESDPRKGAPLAESFVTVAERLRDAGYGTVGIAGNRAFLHPAYGLSQGFDAWICDQLIKDARGVPYNPLDRVIPLAEHALQTKGDRPLFLFVNLMDAHTPYVPRKGYVADASLIQKKTLPGHKRYTEASTLLMSGGELDATVAASWTAAYDSEIRWIDHGLGELLPAVAGVPHVFILADHGEYLGEHKLVEHGKDVYEPATRIPFLAKSPLFAAGTDESLVQSHDLAWMILKAAGLPADPAMEHTADVAVSEQYYALKKDLSNKAYGSRFKRVRRSFRIGYQKLIVGSDGTRESFDLAADPGELKPTATLDARFGSIEAEWTGARPERAVTPASEQTVAEPTDKELQALGYAE
jgi:arylsulfatase A-like enzyme